MHNLKYRVLVIVGLVIASIWALFPRQVIKANRHDDGTITYDTSRAMPLKLGLDLQGGMHLALEIDESKGAVADKSEALDRALTVVRERIDEFGVAEPVVQKIGDERIIVELPGIDDPERAIEVVQRSAFLQFQITDETRALERVLPRIDNILRQQGAAGATTTAARQGGAAGRQGGLENLFTPGDSAADTAAADTARADTSALDSTVLGASGGPLSSLLNQGSIPGQYLVAAKDVPTVERYLSIPAVREALPPGKVIRWQSDSLVAGGQVYKPLYVLDARPIITGEYLIDANPATDPMEGTTVQFELNNEGGRRFRAETARHIRDYMAIVLDDRVMGFPPVIQSAIGTRGQITLGGQSLEQAQDLALVLRAGALPVPLSIVEVRTIGPSLGQDAIEQGVRAGILGIILTIAIMIGYYRFSGVLACAALVLYALFTLAALAGFDAVLTLPGIAGLVLSIGIAVDANVLIFERIREELDHGKTVRTAIDEGFRGAMSAIVDSNVTTALTALILYQFGTGPVRGFAVTLLAGIAASMISAIFVVRTFFLIWLQRNRGAQTVSI